MYLNVILANVWENFWGAVLSEVFVFEPSFSRGRETPSLYFCFPGRGFTTHPQPGELQGFPRSVMEGASRDVCFSVSSVIYMGVYART